MTALRNAFVALDRALTGKDPQPTADARKLETIEAVLEVPGGIVYLSDGGYSRLLVDFSPEGAPQLGLALGARAEVRSTWEVAAVERAALEQELAAAVQPYMGLF